MQAEKSIEINDRLARNVDAGAHRVVLRFAMRDDHVETVGRAALEDHDEAFGARTEIGDAEDCASEKARHGGRADNGESTVAKKDATRDVHASSPFPVLNKALAIRLSVH